MQTFSNPMQHNSTAIGRWLLEWYFCKEGYCCFNAAYKPPLSIAWRNASVFIRQSLARDEYPRLSPEERIFRLIDDLWAQFRSFLAVDHDMQLGLLQLKTM